MIGTHLRQGRRLCHWGMVFAMVVCASARDLQAQRRGNPPIDIPLAPDPDDPAREEAARQKKASRYLEQARQLMEKNKIKQAKSKYKAVIGLVGLEGLGQSAFNGLMTIHRQGMDSLNRAKTLYEDKKYREALKLAKECKVLYSSIWVGVEAASDAPNVSRLAVKLIKRIEADPQAEIAFQEYEASKRARKIPRLERRAEKDPTRYLDIYKALRSIAKTYPECDTGKRCAEHLAKLKSDKKIWTIIKEERRRRYIASALNDIKLYEKAGLQKKAESVYKKLAKKYPGKSLEELEKMAKK